MGSDEDKADEHTLALLYLFAHDRNEGRGARSWKVFDLDAMNRLHEKGLISDPSGKSRSIAISEEGFRRAEELFRKYFSNK